mmetsp:Transcript_21484/g.64485  ORF Transcript_21484/g.64485 Transcript_21484/m.64485 type:complete len:428 (+) Transcript_21484:132-1415(+)
MVGLHQRDDLVQRLALEADVKRHRLLGVEVHRLDGGRLVLEAADGVRRVRLDGELGVAGPVLALGRADRVPEENHLGLAPHAEAAQLVAPRDDALLVDVVARGEGAIPEHDEPQRREDEPSQTEVVTRLAELRGHWGEKLRDVTLAVADRMHLLALARHLHDHELGEGEEPPYDIGGKHRAEQAHEVRDPEVDAPGDRDRLQGLPVALRAGEVEGEPRRGAAVALRQLCLLGPGLGLLALLLLVGDRLGQLRVEPLPEFLLHVVRRAAKVRQAELELSRVVKLHLHRDLGGGAAARLDLCLEEGPGLQHGRGLELYGTPVRAHNVFVEGPLDGHLAALHRGHVADQLLPEVREAGEEEAVRCETSDANAADDAPSPRVPADRDDLLPVHRLATAAERAEDVLGLVLRPDALLLQEHRDHAAEDRHTV